MKLYYPNGEYPNIHSNLIGVILMECTYKDHINGTNNIWFNPVCEPNSLEIFCFIPGEKTTVNEAMKEMIRNHAFHQLQSKYKINLREWDYDGLDEAIDKYVAEFIPWYNK